MNGKELSLALANGTHVYGTAVLSTSPVWPKMVATLGLDFVFIDTEHTPVNRETVSWMCHLYRTLNLAPLVRIPAPEPFQACMVLDGGATGVIAPYIESAEQVQLLVGAVKHKPVKGQKLQDHLSGKQRFECLLDDYTKGVNEQNVLVINIESATAIKNLDAILAVDGLDGVLIGPHDLTCSLGIPEQYQHPLFTDAVESIIEKTRRNGIGVGVHMWDAVGFDQEILWAKKGANLIMHSSDLLLFKSSLNNGLQRIRASLEPAKQQTF